MEDLTEYEVTDQILADLGMPSMAEISRIQRAKRGLLFIKGPIPLEWLCRVDVARHTLVTVLAVKMLIDLGRGREPVRVAPRAWKLLGLSAHPTRKRALDALESAGIIRTERPPGKPTLIWLIDKP